MAKRMGKLHTEEINAYVLNLDKELEKSGITAQERNCARIVTEEVLLDYRDKLGEEADIGIEYRVKSGKMKVRIMISGDSYNPLKDTDSLVLIKTLHFWNTIPTWEYVSGENRISFTIVLFNTMLDNLKFTWKYAGPSRGYLILAVIMQFISVGLLILAPVLSARIITGITENNFAQLFYISVALLATNLLSNGILAICNWAYNVLYNHTLTRLEMDLADEVLRITNGSLDDNGTGLFIQRMTTDTSSLATAFGTFADNLAQVCQYVGTLFAMLIVNPIVFAIALILLSLQVFMETKRQKEVKKEDRIFRNENERYTGIIGEMVRGAKDIKLIRAEKSFLNQLTERIKRANDSRMHRDSQNRKYVLFGGIIRELGLFLFVMLLGILLQKKIINVASGLVLYNYYTLLGSTAIKLLATVMDFVTGFNLSCERIHELMSPAFPKERFGELNRQNISGDIRFDKVRFSYNVHKLGVSTRFVLSDMTFHIEPGEMVAFVGKSGSGKTTLINLIGRIYDAFSGKILIDGTEVKELSQDSLRGSMTVVTQNPYIFQMSIRDNFRIVKADMTEEEMKNAARLACIADDIENMPDRYDTVVGEGGVTLSGGQRQRLAIARSLLKKCSILILDEATSALDNVTQEKIRKVLENLKGKCTVILIAHRLSTIVDCDRIFFIGDGKVQASGTHRELMEQSEEYRELYSAESGEF